MKGAWSIEWVDEGGHIRRTRVDRLPFRIGRAADAQLRLDDDGISKAHAELFDEGKGLRLRDLGSRNGTWLNREKLESDRALASGDLLHVGRAELRLTFEREADDDTRDLTRTMVVPTSGLSDLLEHAQAIERLFAERAVEAWFQEVVRLSDRAVAGYEVLGRGTLADFANSPAELFRAARLSSREAELSRLFRVAGVAAGRDLPGNPALFLNTHPAETERGGGDAGLFLPSLAEARAPAPDAALVLEIHERAITDPKRMKALRKELERLRIGLAYDDFGAGEARLTELADVPPDVLKFDIALVRDIHRAPRPRQALVETLVKMALDLGAQPLAEGVERPEEADWCRQVGFTLAQGYAFGRPRRRSDIGP